MRFKHSCVKEQKTALYPFLLFFLPPALHYMSLCIFVPYQYSIEFLFAILYLGSCAVGLQIFHSFSGMAPSK